MIAKAFPAGIFSLVSYLTTYGQGAHQIGPFRILLLVSVSWTFLFYVNEWLFPSLGMTRFINWIFLPAGLRLLAVMKFGWRGAAGLFAGALMTSLVYPENQIARSLILALMSALGAWVGVRIGRGMLGYSSGWNHLDKLQIYVFASFCAACNAVLHCAYFAYSGMIGEFLDNLIPMFIGDLAGTFILIFAIAKPFCRLMAPFGETNVKSIK